VVNNQIYAMGGSQGGGVPLGTHERYDPATNSWSTAPQNMPIPRYHISCAAVGGKIYVFGGHDGTTWRADTQIYDVANNTWSIGPSLPGGGRHGLRAAVIGKDIYVIGGYNGGYVTWAHEFDTVTGTWRVIESMPTGRVYTSADTVDGKIYVIGGDVSGQTNVVEEYDPSDPDGYRATAFDGRFVYLIPDANGTRQNGEVRRYDTQRDFDDPGAWETYDPGNFGVGDNPDGFLSCFFDGRFLYLVPYYNDLGQHGEFLRYDTRSEFRSPSSWTAFDPGAAGIGTDPDGYIGAVFDGRYAYFAPYHNGSVYHAEVLRYDTTGANASFKLAWSRLDQSGGLSGAPFGISAIVNTTEGAYSVSDNTLRAPGDWHHVAMTFDGTALRLYVDGGLVSSRTVSGSISASWAPVVLGSFFEAGRGLRGDLDEIRMYDRALSAGEILAHSQRRLFADPEPAAGAAGPEETR
jgi:hypothetical protein